MFSVCVTVSLWVGKAGRLNTEMIHQPGGHTSDIMVALSHVQNPPRLSYETSQGRQAWVSIANQVLLTSWILSWSLAKDESPVLVNTKRRVLGCLPSCISWPNILWCGHIYILGSSPSLPASFGGNTDCVHPLHHPTLKQIHWSLHISYHRWSNAEESCSFYKPTPCSCVELKNGCECNFSDNTTTHSPLWCVISTHASYTCVQFLLCLV